MQNATQKFRARKDWPGALMVLGILGVGAFLVHWHDMLPVPYVANFGYAFLALGAITWWDWVATTYEVTQEELIIRTALGAEAIPLRQLETLEERRGWMRIKYMKMAGSCTATLAPVRRQEFLERLRRKCPWLI
ncbi:MAG: hypothetical protein KDA41_15395 [Planctomycetales bacterium]|nr:hypothetical protein [Planctomycetales bacterium]